MAFMTISSLLFLNNLLHQSRERLETTREVGDEPLNAKPLRVPNEFMLSLWYMTCELDVCVHLAA